MELLHDYYYRFQASQLEMPGRCRVRIYKRGNGAHTVLLTELDSNSGESITGSCEHIATDLAARRGLNPKTTKWILHEVSHPIPIRPGQPHDDLSQVFDEVRFTWDGDSQAGDPQWKALNPDEAMALTGDTLDALARRLGDTDDSSREGSDDA